MSKRPPITLTLDVRSHERIVVFADPKLEYTYPEDWTQCAPGDTVSIDDSTVIIVDRVELMRRELAALLTRGPRILAVAVADLEQEKKFRRNLRTLYPWAEVWETFTDFGKVLMTTTFGRTYDREQVIDMRAASAA